MLIEEGWLTARATTWFLRSRRLAEPMEETFKRFAPAVEALRETAAAEAAASPKAAAWVAAGVPAPLAQRVASADGPGTPRSTSPRSPKQCASERRRGQSRCTSASARASAWRGCASRSTPCRPTATGRAWPRPRSATTWPGCSARSRRRCWRRRGAAPRRLLAAWEARNAAALERAQRVLAELGDAKGADLAMLSVALRELRNLA